jgi:hypothetical protein
MIAQWIELVVRIIKGLILSTVYTSVVFIILFIWYKRYKNSFLHAIFSKGIFYFILAHFLIGVALFSYSFSYWEDTGMGEAPQLPIGYGQVIYSPDYEWTSFFPDLNKRELNKDELIIENFIVTRNFLCAKISHHYSDNPNFDFIVCDLSEKRNHIFLSETDYKKFAIELSLPLPEKFYDFKTHLKEYHENRPGWKKWLLL